MIYDKITNIKQYLGISEYLDTAIHFIAEHNLEELPLGKTVISGDDVFVNIMDAETTPKDSKQFEVHKKYHDIQIDLIGVERIDIGDETTFVCPDFNEEKDIGFSLTDTLTCCTMGAGNFMVCMANEPHMPAITVGNKTAIRKCVFKVRA